MSHSKKSVFIQSFLLSVLSIALWANPYAALCADDIEQINIDVTTHLGDVKNFREGDVVSFLVSLDKNAYLYVIYQDAKGSIVQLIPNKKQNNNYYHAKLFLSIPEPGSGFSFKIQAPFGKEHLWVFASSTPFPEVKGKYLANGLKQLTKNMVKIKKILIDSASSAYGEAGLEIKTNARN